MSLAFFFFFCLTFRDSRQWLVRSAPVWALTSVGPRGGKRKLGAPRSWLVTCPAVTSRKLGLPLGGEKIGARPPGPSLLAAWGFAQALQSPELTVNAVTSGNSQRGRGKGLEERARTPGPSSRLSIPHPQVLFAHLSIKGCRFPGKGLADLPLGCGRKTKDSEMLSWLQPSGTASRD